MLCISCSQKNESLTVSTTVWILYSFPVVCEVLTQQCQSLLAMSKPAYQPPPQPQKRKSSIAVLLLFVMIFGAAVIGVVCETNDRHLCTKASSDAAMENTPTQDFLEADPASSPTPLETNSTKPDFVTAKPILRAKIDAATAVTDILLLTSSPTVSPTPHPTNQVYFF